MSNFRPSGASQETAVLQRDTMLAALDALGAGDDGPFWSLFSPDVVFHEAACLPYGGAHHGIEATKKAHALIDDIFDQLDPKIEQILFKGDMAIIYLQLDFRVRRNGRTGSLPITELYRFRDGKVIEWRALYFDAYMVAETIAAEP